MDILTELKSRIIESLRLQDITVTSLGTLTLVVSVIVLWIAGTALLNMRKRADVNRSRVFIYISCVPFAISTMEGMTETCNFGGNLSWLYMYCEPGLQAAWPSFLASAVLLATAIVIYTIERSEFAAKGLSPSAER